MSMLTKVTNYLQSMKAASDADKDPWGDPVNLAHIKEFDAALTSLDHADITSIASINTYNAEVVWDSLYHNRLFILMDELFTNDHRGVPHINAPLTN